MMNLFYSYKLLGALSYFSVIVSCPADATHQMDSNDIPSAQNITINNSELTIISESLSANTDSFLPKNPTESIIKADSGFLPPNSPPACSVDIFNIFTQASAFETIYVCYKGASGNLPSTVTGNVIRLNFKPATDIGTNWMFFGDSETAGRALEASTKSQVTAFGNIWNQTFSTSLSPYTDGVSGRKLQATHDYYSSIEGRRNATLIHFQESGSQDSTQDTPEKYVNVFESMVRSIASESPYAVISTETAYSFEAESIQGRDWTQHNVLMREKIDELKSDGIVVYLTEVDRNIKELVAQKRREFGVVEGQESVWGDTGNSIGRHYTGLGNLMIALSIYDAFGYEIDTLDLGDIPFADISTDDKQLCIEIINSF